MFFCLDWSRENLPKSGFSRISPLGNGPGIADERKSLARGLVRGENLVFLDLLFLHEGELPPRLLWDLGVITVSPPGLCRNAQLCSSDTPRQEYQSA